MLAAMMFVKMMMVCDLNVDGIEQMIVKSKLSVKVTVRMIELEGGQIKMRREKTRRGSCKHLREVRDLGLLSFKFLMI